MGLAPINENKPSNSRYVHTSKHWGTLDVMTEDGYSPNGTRLSPNALATLELSQAGEGANDQYWNLKPYMYQESRAGSRSTCSQGSYYRPSVMGELLSMTPEGPSCHKKRLHDFFV